MATYKGHSAGGALSGFAAVLLLGTAGVMNIPAIALATLAGMMADIDHRGSWISRRLLFLHGLYKWALSNWLTWKLFGKQRMVTLVGHRNGLTHTLLGWFSSSVLVGLLIFFGVNALAEHGIALRFLELGEETWLLSIPGLSEVGRVSVLLSFSWALGYASHLLLDMFTYSGIALFYPWSDQRIGIGPQSWRYKMKKWGVADD